MLRILLVLSTAAIWMPAAAQTRVDLAPESLIIIDGSSTLNRFSCEAEDVSGTGVFAAERSIAYLSVPVRDFDCGRKRMNRDLREAMDADRHPEIRFELVQAEGSGTGDLEVRGLLTIAGVTRTIVVRPEAEETSPGAFRVRGAMELQMSDFGIDPPAALAGLVRAHDDIVVRFDVRARIPGTGGRRETAFSINHTQ